MAFATQLALVRTAVLLLSLRSSGQMPLMPKIHYCVSFWAKNITCYWDLLPETHSPITYTLHITEESGRCRQDFGRPSRCVARWGERSCGVPVENLFAFYKIQLTAESRGVQVRSLEKCIQGMAVVKLSSPMVNALLANQSRCFQLEWSLPGDEVVSVSEAQYEIQYRDVAEKSWAQVNFTAAENGQAFANICGVSPFTNYSVRVRAKYLLSHSLQGDGDPFWSNWSPERYVRTLPAVPSRGPALWRKFGISGADGKRDVILMWKPLKPKEANGEILIYSLFSQRKGESAGPQCLTRELQCTLRLLMGAGYTFSITARNIAGVSPVTSLIVLPSDGQEELSSTFPVLASPATDHSFLLRWSLPHFPAIRYVFEWGRLPRKKGEDVFWHDHSGNTNHMVIAEAIMPGNLYSLKVFVLIHGNVWASGSTSGYSKQTAPLRAPTLYPSQIWKTEVALQWEMLPLEERGGVIRNYTLCYKEEGENERAVILDSSIQRYIIRGLAPASIVHVYLTVATEGGSTRGSVLSVRTKSDEYGKAEVLILAFSVGFLLLFGSLACVYRYRWYVVVSCVFHSRGGQSSISGLQLPKSLRCHGRWLGVADLYRMDFCLPFFFFSYFRPTSRDGREGPRRPAGRTGAAPGGDAGRRSAILRLRAMRRAAPRLPPSPSWPPCLGPGPELVLPPPAAGARILPPGSPRPLRAAYAM
uniref:Granulocyte colony-stimulating factor receptor-like n=1 Tax=Pogona vitticeps TaxID=103695 RepID=A0ABM5ENZ0_9SAUR